MQPRVAALKRLESAESRRSVLSLQNSSAQTTTPMEERPKLASRSVGAFVIDVRFRVACCSPLSQSWTGSIQQAQDQSEIAITSYGVES
jgi:hypothetical protein